MPQLAIIGAGMAGMAAAHTLTDRSDLKITVFEKSRGLSGRAATRRRGDICFDHGANFFRIDTPPLEALISGRLPTTQLRTIEKGVWVHDQQGTIRPGDPGTNAEPRWTYAGGISTLGKLLAADANALIHKRTRIHSLAKEKNHWVLRDTDGHEFGLFDAVVLTPPAPQTAELIAASRISSGFKERLERVLKKARYQSQITCIFGFDTPPVEKRSYHALLNTDRLHPIAWLSFEEDKPGHVGPGQSVLIVQMAPFWSTPRYQMPEADVVRHVLGHVRSLLQRPDLEPSWSDIQRWRYALPVEHLAWDDVAFAQDIGLFFAGDAFASKGRVQRALETGWQAAAHVLAFVDKAEG